ncbi:MAG: 4Fe-4S binding protein [Gammaproteobacteria bacterium]
MASDNVREAAIYAPAVTRDFIEPATHPGLLPRAARAIESFFLVHREKLGYVHAVMFVLFLALIFGPLFVGEPPEGAEPFDHLVPLANYVLWGLWFPLVFISVIVTGRSWCGLLCPMGAASEFANRRGLMARIPAWIRWEGTPIVSFVVITLLGQTLGVRDHPEAIAGLFGGTMLAAILVGLLYGKYRRAWCRHMCPIGLLLGIFSRLGAVEFRPKKKVAGGDRWVEKGPCPTLIDIVRKEESRHCIECFRCVHKKPDRGLKLRFRLPGEEVANIRHHHPNLYEVFFLFIGTGIALGGFLWLVLPIYQEWRQAFGVWAIENDYHWIGEIGPAWLMSVHPERREVFLWLDFLMIVGFMGLVTLVVTAALSALTALSAVVSGRFQSSKSPFKERFAELGYQFAPVAMVSLVIGLGGELFHAITLVGLDAGWIQTAKTALFLLALGWSFSLGVRILRNQSVSGGGLAASLMPGLLGSLFVGGGWWLAIM